MTNFNEMTRDDLRATAKSEGLKVAGTKAELVERLERHEAAGIWNDHSDGHHEGNAGSFPNCPDCVADLAAKKAKPAKREQEARRGGRSLIPGMTLAEAIDAVGQHLAGLIAMNHAKDGGPVDVFAIVEDELVMGDHEGYEDVVAATGNVLRDYLTADRRDRYNFILRKVYQATGRHLAKRGLNRKTATQA